MTMMKRMMGAALCAMLGGCVITVGSGGAAEAQGVGTKRFAVAGFDAVDLAGSDNVRVVRSDSVSVVASGDPRAVAALMVTVDRGTLRISRKPGRWQDRGATVTVTVPSLRAATLSGSGAMDVGAMAPTFDARLPGSGELTLRDLHGETVRMELAGSGDLTASGTVRQADIRLAGSGDIDARALAVRDLSVDLGGSGTVRAQASDTASLSIGGSGDVTVAGHPRCTVRKSGSGTVRCG
ncbi:head GIN domain-containing protein [Sphingomonas sp. S-NIH.Pt15_0812]|uniref:head GIN domain-containing protein n=1 Tax=Sphingomonas sp. S-NIH.Pt15_0812 TaxID=1920129 RepID=UPI0019D0BE14|nr:head GIN domain-containing protein [Sphingomonas sp. S-NIH.Pt15_0812]